MQWKLRYVTLSRILKEPSCWQWFRRTVRVCVFWRFRCQRNVQSKFAARSRERDLIIWHLTYNKCGDACESVWYNGKGTKCQYILQSFDRVLNRKILIEGIKRDFSDELSRRNIYIPFPVNHCYYLLWKLWSISELYIEKTIHVHVASSQIEESLYCAHDLRWRHGITQVSLYLVLLIKKLRRYLKGILYYTTGCWT